MGNGNRDTSRQGHPTLTLELQTAPDIAEDTSEESPDVSLDEIKEEEVKVNDQEDSEATNS